MLGLTSCFDLDKTPEGVLSTANPFNSVGEMRSYVDQFYQNAVRNQSFNTYATGGNIAEYDVYSDNMSGTVITRLNGALSIANASALSGYTNIRKVNFLINHADNCSDYYCCCNRLFALRFFYLSNGIFVTRNHCLFCIVNSAFGQRFIGNYRRNSYYYTGGRPRQDVFSQFQYIAMQIVGVVVSHIEGVDQDEYACNQKH